MSKIIIGIHGLGNKPPPKTLSAWWKAAIREGLERIQKPRPQFTFELVYWAHYLYPIPLKPRIKDTENPFYVEDPYVRAKKDPVMQKPSEFRQKILDYLNEQLEKIFLNEDLSINYESITDFIIHHFFSDLEKYYHNYCVRRGKQDCRAKMVICSHMANTLKKHRRKKILLIGHSMGSIIAYDVLTQYATKVPVDSFVTIGSPLGLPVIKSRLAAEFKKDSSQPVGLKTPNSIQSNWYNLSDLKDKIAFDYRLNDDFGENAAYIRPVDKIVSNNYEIGGKNNPHKSYGYLRTPEMAKIIANFLNDNSFIHEPS
jgi:PGAP1-like protein